MIIDIAAFASKGCRMKDWADKAAAEILAPGWTEIHEMKGLVEWHTAVADRLRRIMESF